MKERELEERLREALHDDARRFRPTPDAWDRVRSRLGSGRQGSRRLTFAGLGGLVAAGAALATAGVLLVPLAFEESTDAPDRGGASVALESRATRPSSERSASSDPSPAAPSADATETRAEVMAEVAVDRDLRVTLVRSDGAVTLRAYRWRRQGWTRLDGTPAVGPSSDSGQPLAEGVCELRVAAEPGDEPTVHVRLAPAASGCSDPYVFEVSEDTVSPRTRR